MDKVTKHGPDRRELLAGAAALGIAAFAPLPAVRPEFAAAYGEFLEAMTMYRQARHASCLRARNRGMMRARMAALAVVSPPAMNDVETAMQAEALVVAEQELGADDGLRNCYPPGRRIHAA